MRTAAGAAAGSRLNASKMIFAAEIVRMQMFILPGQPNGHFSGTSNTAPISVPHPKAALWLASIPIVC